MASCEPAHEAYPVWSVRSSGRSSEQADGLYIARSTARRQALKLADLARFAETRSGGRKNCLESTAISIP